MHSLMPTPHGPDKPALFLTVSIAALSLGLLSTFALLRVARRHVVLLHALYCVALNSLLAARTTPETDTIMAAIRQTLNPLVAQCLQTADPAGITLDHLMAFVASNSQLTVTLIARYQLLALAFMGLSVWTVPAMASFPICFAVQMTIPWSGNVTVIGGAADYTCEFFAFLFMAVCMERLRRSAFLTELLLARELHNSRTSDSILNHVLKNTLADAAGGIEAYLRRDGDGSDASLADALLCLRRGMKRCRDRQAFLKLVAGTYTPTYGPVHLPQFAQELVEGRAIAVDVVARDVLLDPVLLNLILDNALANAFKHGCPEDPNVHLSFRDERISCDRMRLRITVTNRAHPDRPALTPDFVARAFAGAIVHRTGHVPWMSDQIGLSHCLVAAQAHDVCVSLTQDGDIVTLTATLDVQEAREQPVPSLATIAAPTSFPPGLTFFLLDDSPTTLTLLAARLRRSAPMATVHPFGLSPGDVDVFSARAMKEADVVICDQHLQYGDTAFLGSDIIAGLSAAGFPGLLCIRSANMDPEDADLYRQCGAHCAVGKDVGWSEFLPTVARAYAALHYRSPRLPLPRPLSLPCTVHSTSHLSPASSPLDGPLRSFSSPRLPALLYEPC